MKILFPKSIILLTTIRITILILTTIIFSCSSISREDVAKKLIKDHLFVTLHDYKSYEPVKFEKLDSSFTSYTDDSTYREYKKLFEEQMDDSKNSNEMAKIYSGLTYSSSTFKRHINNAISAQDSAEALLDKMTKIADVFEPEFNGWMMIHSYRAKNLSGNVTINHFEYLFDKNLTKVVDHEDIGGEDEHHQQ